LSNGACPEKQSCPEILHCIEYTFYYSGVLSNLRLRWKTKGALNPQYWIYFLLFRNLSNSALALKNSVALEFFTVLKYILSFRIFEQLALVLKKRVILKIFIVWNILFTFRIFEQLALVLKKRVCSRIFHCIEYLFFIIQDFWATCACPEKNRVAQKIFTVLEYILSFRIFEQLSLALKNRVALKIFTVFFIIQDFWATCACPENRVCPEIFQARGGCRPHASYAYAHVLSFAYRGRLRKWRAHCSTVGLHFVTKYGNKPAKVHLILRYSRSFVPWDCWTHTSWQVMQRESGMLIAVSHVGLRLYFV